MDIWYRFLAVASIGTSMILMLETKASQQIVIVQMALAICFATVILLMRD